MAHTENWDASYEAEPADSDSPATGDDEFRDLKRNVRERMLYEHQWKDSPTTDGHHKEGSARTYYTNSAPTTRPDGSTALDSDDMGRIWFDINDTNALYHWTGTTWCGDVKFASNVDITGALDVDTITGPLHIASNIDVTGTLTVGGVVDLNSNVNIAGTLTVSGVVDLDSNVQIAGTLTVAGATDLDGTLNVAGASILDQVTIVGVFTIGAGANVTGDIELVSNARIKGGGHAGGYKHGSNVTENAIFDEMAGELGDSAWMLVSGTLRRQATRLWVSRAVRSGNTITLYGINSNGHANTFEIENGCADTFDACSLAW